MTRVITEAGAVPGEFEQLVLLAVLRLETDAYGVSIRDVIVDLTGRPVTLGALYATLRRLERKGLVEGQLGEAEPVRGGRAKKFFSLTDEGTGALRRSWSQLHALADGLEAQLEVS